MIPLGRKRYLQIVKTLSPENRRRITRLSASRRLRQDLEARSLNVLKQILDRTIAGRAKRNVGVIRRKE